MRVIDVGMYDGADTAYYLESGHSVIAIEANPVLCEAAREKFSRYSGMLQILHVAISAGEHVDLTICGQELGSSSIHAERISKRYPLGSYRVPARTLPDIIREHGVADFIKIDIEGADEAAVLSLTKNIAPRYLSFEAPEDITPCITHLSNIGYGYFKAIHQTSFRSLNRQNHLGDRISYRLIRTVGFREPRYVKRCGRFFALGHSAGPAPWESDGKWLSAKELSTEWNLSKELGRMSAWYDIHAMR